MYKIIDGNKIAEKIKDKIALEVFKHKEVRPSLAIILVGSREDSKLYVSLKEREAKKLGIDTHLYIFPKNSKPEEVLEVIDFLNKDNGVDAILVQLPLPDQFETDAITKAIDPKKDADGFHPQSPVYIKSPVLSAVLACLDEISLKGEGKTACVLNKSEIFGNSLKKVLEDRGFKIIDKKNIKEADLVVSAIGEPSLVKKEMMKDGVVLIDIGITKEENKVRGDIDIDAAKEKASYLSPVPGGIGPITIAFLFKNVLEIFNHNKK